MRFGLEALDETIQKHNEGQYKDQALKFSQRTTDIKSSGTRGRAITSEEGKLLFSGIKKSYGTGSSNSISKADQIKNRLKASKMEQFEDISLQKSIYMESP